MFLAYAPIGQPAILKIGKSLKHNMTFTVSLSTNGIELIQTFDAGGTTNGTFERYFEKLINTLLNKYPDKVFIIVLDNL